MKKRLDTLRIVVTWRCNLRCAYCCNLDPALRSEFRLVREIGPTSILFSRYRVVCITGGEPLLELKRVRDVCKRAMTSTLVVLCTNGTLLTADIADTLAIWGVRAINVGLHDPVQFRSIIDRVRRATRGRPLSVRFQANDEYRDLNVWRRYHGVAVSFWKMNECLRPNEDRVTLAPWPPSGTPVQG